MGEFAITTTSTNTISGKITWSESNVNISNNTSDLTVTLMYYKPDGQYTTLGSGYYKITVDGQAYEDNHYTMITQGWTTVLTHTFTITHNADGTKAASIVLNHGYISGTTGLSASSGSGTATLTTIARASQPSTTNGTFGSAITINTNRASSSFTHTLTMTMGSHSETKTGVGASLSWTIPASWADTIPAATSNTLSISCITYSGSTNIGTKTTSCTATIPDSWKPSVSITKTLTNGGDNSQVLVNVTTVNLTANGTASTGTSISSYSWSGGTVSGTGASKTHSPTTVATFTYTVTVTDRRGRTGSASVTATSESGISSMSCNSSVNFGSALAVTITRKKSSFTHNVTWQISSSYTNTATGQGTSASYTIPSSWAASVPAASSINMTVTVTTYNGSSSLGSVNKSVSVVVPSSWVPAFTLTAEAVSAFNSLYLKGVSKVKLTASSVSASTGSQIQSYSFSGNNLNKSATTTATSYNVTSDLLSVVGSNTYTVKVTDKRGRVTTKTSTITVTDYKAPTLNLSVGRYTSGGVADSFGSYGRMTATGTWSAVSGNKWTLTLKQKLRSASSYTTVNTYSNQTTSSISKTSDLFSANVDSVYDCQATLTDSVGKSVTVTVAISTGRALRDLFKDKVVAFFSTASEALRTALGSPATLFYSNAERNYLNGRVYVPVTNSIDGLSDGWQLINDATSYVCNFVGTNGSTGYVKFARIEILQTYVNSVFEFDIVRRAEKMPTRIYLSFLNANSTDPSLNAFWYEGVNPYVWIVRGTSGIWDLYVQKAEAWDSIAIYRYQYHPFIKGKVKITFTDEHATSLPSGAVQVSPVSISGTFTKDSAQPSAFSNNVVIRRCYSAISMYGFITGVTFNSGQTCIGQISGVPLPPVPVRSLASVGTNAYTTGTTSYIFIDTNGKVYVDTSNTGSMKAIYFDMNYIV